MENVMTKNAVLALFLMGAVVPSAQAAVGLAVDNLGNTADTFGSNVGGVNMAAGSFTTGAVTTWLDHIDLSLRDSASTTMTVGLYADLGGKPDVGTLIKALTSPGVITTAGNYSFSGSTTLSASTTYWVVASADATTTWNRTATTSEAASYTGWTMGDKRGWSANSGTTWSTYGSAQQFAVYADTVPEPEALAGVLMSGMFGLVALKRRRRTQVESSSESGVA
jgi:hypothetical protein